MGEVRYPAYRAHLEQRTDANSAIMAFLAGAQLAAHTLKLTEGSHLLLPEVFPNVQHIRRFNLQSSLAIEILGAGETHLGAMAMPYVLAIHEDFVISSALDLLRQSGRLSSNSYRAANPSNMHEKLEAATGQPFSAGLMEAFHLLRLTRNSLIHAGGKASDQLAAACRSVGQDAEAIWKGVTRQPSAPSHREGDRVVVAHDEIVAALAITKRLVREINDQLQGAVGRALWASMVHQDAIQEWPNLGNPAQIRRRLNGKARFYYAPLNLTEAELLAPAIAAGHRT